MLPARISDRNQKIPPPCKPTPTPTPTPRKPARQPALFFCKDRCVFRPSAVRSGPRFGGRLSPRLGLATCRLKYQHVDSSSSSRGQAAMAGWRPGPIRFCFAQTCMFTCATPSLFFLKCCCPLCSVKVANSTRLGQRDTELVGRPPAEGLGRTHAAAWCGETDAVDDASRDGLLGRRCSIFGTAVSSLTAFCVSWIGLLFFCSVLLEQQTAVVTQAASCLLFHYQVES